MRAVTKGSRIKVHDMSEVVGFLLRRSVNGVSKYKVMGERLGAASNWTVSMSIGERERRCALLGGVDVHEQLGAAHIGHRSLEGAQEWMEGDARY